MQLLEFAESQAAKLATVKSSAFETGVIASASSATVAITNPILFTDESFRI